MGLIKLIFPGAVRASEGSFWKLLGTLIGNAILRIVLYVVVIAISAILTATGIGLAAVPIIVIIDRVITVWIGLDALLAIIVFVIVKIKGD